MSFFCCFVNYYNSSLTHHTMIDFLNNDGTGKTCIYGTSTFNDENLTTHKHDKPGMLCMANSGPNTNGCQVCVYPIWCMIMDMTI